MTLHSRSPIGAALANLTRTEESDMPKTKTTGFYFKASQEEMEWIEKGMKQANINNKSPI